MDQEQLIHHIYALRPNNWEELSKYAAQVRDRYLQMDVSEIQNAEIHGMTCLLADAIRLGATASIMEKKPGDFSSYEMLRLRATEATSAGLLIQTFSHYVPEVVDTINRITGPNSERKKTNYLGGVSKGWHQRVLEITSTYERVGSPPRLKPETVADIVAQEVGLPPPLRGIVLQALSLG